MKAGPARPVAQSSPVKPDSLPGIDVGLAVKGQMVAELRDDDLGDQRLRRQPAGHDVFGRMRLRERSEEHTSELQSLMRISYAVFCLKKKQQPTSNYKI